MSARHIPTPFLRKVCDTVERTNFCLERVEDYESLLETIGVATVFGGSMFMQL